MKKIFNFFAIVLIGATATGMTACGDGEKQKSKITTDPVSLSYNSEGDTRGVTITSKIAYTVTPSDSWIEIEEVEGGITVTVGATTEPRNGAIVIESKDDSKTIPVTQSGPSLTIGTATLEFGSAGDTKNVTITSESAYTITPSETWIIYTEVEGGIDVTLDATLVTRDGEILIENETTSETISIVQYGPTLTISVDSFEFAVSGDTKKLDITSETAYTVTPSASWITYSEVDGGINITVGGAATEPRSGEILIENTWNSKTIEITQDGRPAPADVFGTISFKTDNTWVVGNQTWSDAVMVSNARGKTTYSGGDLTGVRLVDFRENVGYYDLFSWEAVNIYKDVLCPDGWRVPTRQDFVDLDIEMLGGNGENRYVDSDDYYNNYYLNANVWGGELGGRIEGEMPTMMGQMWWGHYWSQTIAFEGSGNSYHLSLGLGAWYIAPQEAVYQVSGFGVRCVK